MASTNQTIAGLFLQMADVLEIIDGDKFRINAFRKIARVLEELGDDLASIGADEKALSKYEGIGKSSAQRIAEYLTTGRMKDHDELMAKVPPGLLELRSISGLGPKTIAMFWKEAGISNLEQLRAKLATDALAGLPGMGQKKLDNLRKSLAFAESAGGRVRIGQAMPVAVSFVRRMRELKTVKHCDYTGSLRRGKETIGDIDILVAADPNDAAAISDHFIKLDGVSQVLVHGETKSSVRTTDNLQVDLRVVEPGSYGAALMYFTGSKEHNIKLRERAIKQHARLNEYGLYNEDATTLIAAATEEDVYKALGLSWIAPPLREDRGEIALAQDHKLPLLVSRADIRAELHAHTTASDGMWSIRGLAEAAAEHGLEVVAVTDHSRSQFQANGLDEARLERHIVEVRKVAQEMKNTITILAGTEVDILADGKLDYPNSLLAQLDVVVASPHAALTQDPRKATVRLLKAIDNPCVTILGHPTGRLIGRREGLSPDMKQLIAAARQRGIALEINANSYRLDLRDTHAKMAIDAGVKLAINTDAHGPADLNELQYGVLTAQRAGATREDVINCLSMPALLKWLQSTRL
jgi:DNA polymerase (family 10)